jgi:hypothetical protein
MAIELLQVLSVQSTRQWHDIVTLDESWIYLFSGHDLMWTAPGETAVDREDGPFASVRQLSRLIHLPSTIVYRRLTQSLGFVARYLR